MLLQALLPLLSTANEKRSPPVGLRKVFLSANCFFPVQRYYDRKLYHLNNNNTRKKRAQCVQSFAFTVLLSIYHGLEIDAK